MFDDLKNDSVPEVYQIVEYTINLIKKFKIIENILKERYVYQNDKNLLTEGNQ